jgi:hypothetical protein
MSFIANFKFLSAVFKTQYDRHRPPQTTPADHGISRTSVRIFPSGNQGITGLMVFAFGSILLARLQLGALPNQ